MLGKESFFLNSSHTTFLLVAAAIFMNSGQVLIVQRKAGERLAGKWKLRWIKLPTESRPSNVQYGKWRNSWALRFRPVSFLALTFAAKIKSPSIYASIERFCNAS
jgi:hypothetical protein